jgi:hypothetical protein
MAAVGQLASGPVQYSLREALRPISASGSSHRLVATGAGNNSIFKYNSTCMASGRSRL